VAKQVELRPNYGFQFADQHYFFSQIMLTIFIHAYSLVYRGGMPKKPADSAPMMSAKVTEFKPNTSAPSFNPAASKDFKPAGAPIF